MAKGKYIDWITPEGLLKIEGWARNGLTDEQIASNIDINVATLYRWKNDYREICDALKRGKEVVDLEVENALLKRALGYSYKEITRERNIDTGQLVVTKEVTKEVVPDTTAQIFWLKNRKPEQWRDRRLDVEEQQARINKIKAETAKISGTDGDEVQDDGFIDALRSEVQDVWQE